MSHQHALVPVPIYASPYICQDIVQAGREKKGTKEIPLCRSQQQLHLMLEASSTPLNNVGAMLLSCQQASDGTWLVLCALH